MQDDLFDNKFYPEKSFRPLHPIFRGRAVVQRHKIECGEPGYKVNLNTGECECQQGAAFVWYSDQKVSGKWISNRYCVHKLKAMADIVEKEDAKENPEVLFALMKAIATRYNAYEVVSAFHKYLRLGNIERAMYFGFILSTFRAAKGVIRYLLAIVYEESRDHLLCAYLSDLMGKPQIELIDMTRAIMWFCETPKKWDLHETRLPLWVHEMQGYKRLIKEFGTDVAKAQEIIASEMVPVFLAGIGKALKKKDYDYLQYCVKGMQKSKFPDGIKSLHQLRWLVINELMKHTKLVNAYVRGNVKRFYTYLENKPEKVGISYHDLNAFADLFSGEPYRYGNLNADRIAEIMRIKKLPVFPFDKFPSIPIFAHDNHTYRGKALLKKFAAQIPYGTEQTHIDLRGCGAYIGVGWRYLAMADKGTIRCEWHEPKAPAWLRDLTTQLFY